MIRKTFFYYFSPTGGTKRIGETFAKAAAENVVYENLGDRSWKEEGEGDGEDVLTVVALPVYGGRIPELAAEKLRMVTGRGRKAVTLAVYGTRAYEDALLEMNDLLEERGFRVIASGAFIAQHSIVNIVGRGRPDARDMEEIQKFAEKVLHKIETNEDTKVTVPGSRPYRNGMGHGAAPVSTDACTFCGCCEQVCPAGAVTMLEKEVRTDAGKCILCMACTAVCPTRARVLPAAVYEPLEQKLGPLKDVYRENEIFL